MVDVHEDVDAGLAVIVFLVGDAVDDAGGARRHGDLARLEHSQPQRFV
jgi:hypothetical protein